MTFRDSQLTKTPDLRASGQAGLDSGGSVLAADGAEPCFRAARKPGPGSTRAGHGRECGQERSCPRRYGPRSQNARISAADGIFRRHRYKHSVLQQSYHGTLRNMIPKRENSCRGRSNLKAQDYACFIICEAQSHSHRPPPTSMKVPVM